MSCDVPRVYVIGAGNVGSRLLDTLDRAAVPAMALTRATGLDRARAEGDPALLVVAVREEQLDEVLGALYSVPRERVVLVQNGFLEALHGDLGGVTRGLVWFTAKGEFFHQLAPTIFHGPRATFVADALAKGGIDTRVVADALLFRREMIAKALWNAAVGLPPFVHGETLGTYLATRAEEWRAVLAEGAEAAGRAYGVHVDAAEVGARLLATTGPIAGMRGGAKALPWRNGAIAHFGRRHDVPTPVNDRLLRAAGYDPDDPPVTFRDVLYT